MSRSSFSVIGAKEHNLKNVNCRIPTQRLVVITGPSGAGKSSLAFDTVHAEAYRRYVEFLPSSVRRTVAHLRRPDVDEVSGLTPTVALKQGLVSPNARATVGTITETLDYFRVFFARGARAHCPIGAHPLTASSAQQIVTQLTALPAGTRLTLMTPIVSEADVDAAEKAVASLRERGFSRVVVNGTTTTIDDLDVRKLGPKVTLLLVVDRVVVKDGISSRLTDSVELALRQERPVVFADLHDGRLLQFSERLYCTEHDCELPSPTPALFSHTAKEGRCETCHGHGHSEVLDPVKVVPNPRLTLRQGALAVFGQSGTVSAAILLERLLREVKLDPDVPWTLLDVGTDVWNEIERVVASEDSTALSGSLTESEVSNYRTRVVCPSCNGTRLGPHRDYFTLDGKTFPAYCARTISELSSELTALAGNAMLDPALPPLLEVLNRKLASLQSLGLEHLTLDRPLSELASGEAHRARLSCLLTASLSGVTYVVDEPTLGLHPKDAQLVVEELAALTTRGNSVLAVEHSRTFIERADWVIDMGPGAGRHGGQIVAEGTPASLSEQQGSVTGPYLFGKLAPCSARHELSPPTEWFELWGARAGNLRSIDVRIPKGRLVAVTGRSGAGKTSLVMATLLPSITAVQRGGAPPSALLDRIDGCDISRVITFDQSALGVSPRSTPATYTGVWDAVRELFATLPESRAKGYKAARFSYNIKGGRCETCKGEGVLRTELELLADVVVPCSECEGRRFNRETLGPKFRGYNVAEVLAATVDDAQRLLSHLPKVSAVLLELQRVGLGYLTLGQPSNSLSGGEAQRVRLALELSKRGQGPLLYLFDEPTSGLHFTDIAKVYEALVALRDEGHTVVIAEPNPDVVLAADWVIELGPGAGAEGGLVTFAGPASTWLEPRTAP